MKVLVTGATGSIGREVVAEALRCGHQVRALVHSRAAVTHAGPIEVVVGDLSKPATLASAVPEINAIVFTHGTYAGTEAAEAVDYGGVRNVLLALAGRRPRICLMTAISVTDGGERHNWKRRAERLVRASGATYTIVRPGWFDHNGPGQQRLVFLQGDERRSGTPADGAVARRQIAKVLVASLVAPNASHKTFELITENGSEQQDFGPSFAALEADGPQALDGVHDLANLPIAAEPRGVANDLVAVSAIQAP
jgi:uncharacterized protein YbjT (DUF2867 family)